MLYPTGEFCKLSRRIQKHCMNQFYEVKEQKEKEKVWAVCSLWTGPGTGRVEVGLLCECCL